MRRTFCPPTAVYQPVSPKTIVTEESMEIWSYCKCLPGGKKKELTQDFVVIVRLINRSRKQPKGCGYRSPVVTAKTWPHLGYCARRPGHTRKEWETGPEIGVSVLYANVCSGRNKRQRMIEISAKPRTSHAVCNHKMIAPLTCKTVNYVEFCGIMYLAVLTADFRTTGAQGWEILNVRLSTFKDIMRCEDFTSK